MICGRESCHHLLIYYQFQHIKGFTQAPSSQEPSFQFWLPSTTRHVSVTHRGAKDSLKTKPWFALQNLETKRKTTNHSVCFF